MSVITVTDNNFEKTVLKSQKTVLVEFCAPWSEGYKKMKTLLEDISNTLGNKLIIATIDINSNPETMEKYGVRELPTFLVFQKGKPTYAKIGTLDKSNLQSWIEERL